MTPDHSFTAGNNGGTTSYTPEVTVTDPGGGQDTDTTKQITVYNDFDGDGLADIDNPSPSDISGDDDDDDDGIDDGHDPGTYNTDTDGDGISDDVEATNATTTLSDINSGGNLVDTDGDGTSDIQDSDSDNDGTLDSNDGTSDADGDGYDDYRDDAPVFTGGDSLTTIHEDADPSEETVDSAIGGNFDDSTGGGSNSFHGILITNDASTSGEGTWEYSKDGGSTWYAVGSPSTDSALFVHKDDHLRFNPAADFDGTPGSLTVHAVDGAESFSTEDKKDVSTFGRLSGVSNAGGESLDITVRDAPEVSSIDRATGDGNPTSASSVDFDVTFTDSVDSAAVDTIDFTTTQVSGDVSGSVSGVSGSGSSYTVTVDSITGDGDLRLDLNDDGSITGTSNGVELGGVLTTGAGDGSHVGDESFTVDNTSPSLTDDSGSTDEDSSATIVADLTSNDNDDTSLTVTKVDGNGGNVGSATAGNNGGQFTIASDGTVDFDPNGNFESLGGSETDTTEIQATVEDAVGNADTQTVTATVTGVNDAPTMSSDTRTLADIGEDAADNSGTTASTLLNSAGTTSDVEGDTLGVAVTGVDNTDGTWEYSTDGGNTWTGFSSPSASSARLLADDDHVRFVPNDDFSGNAAGSVTVRAWDQTGGSAGTTADTTSTGGSTPYASTTTDADVTVRDAPEVSSIDRATGDGNPTSASSVDFDVTFTDSVTGVDTSDVTTTQVSGDVSGSVSSVSGSGSSYTVTIDSITGDGDLRLDLDDDGSITGTSHSVELGGVGTGSTGDGSYVGDESFTVDNTSPSLTDDSGSTDEDSSATIVADLTSNDNDAHSLSVTKVDGNGGNVGSATAGDNGGQFTIASDGTVDFDPDGDFESLSGSETDTTTIQATVKDALGNADTQTVTATVTGVNDAPTMSSDTRTLADIDEDATDNSGTTASTLLSSAGTTSDVEGDTRGIAVTAVDDTDGTWEYSTDGGNTWTGFSSPSASSARLLADDDHVRFVPNDDFSGNAAGSVTIRAWDQTGGSAGTTADTTSTGGSTPYASTTTDADVTVRDAPEVTSITRNTSTSPNPTNADVVAFIVRFGESVSGVDTTDFTATRINDTVEGTVDSVNRSSGTAFNVTVGDISGSGSLRLDLLDDDSITNGNGVALGGDGTGGVANGSVTDGENFTVYQLASPTFEVTGVTYPETITAGEKVTVGAKIENTGDKRGSQGIAFSIAGDQHGLARLDLDGGESETVQFSYTTGPQDVGDRTVEIASDDDSRSFTLTVEAGGPSALGIALGAEPLFLDQQTTATVRATLVDGSTEIVTENATLDIDNDSVATVDNGVVTARAEGTTTLTAEYRGVSASTTIEVTEGAVSARASASTYTPRLGEDSKTAPVRLRATESVVSGADPSFVWRREANGTEHTATGKRHATTFTDPGPAAVTLEVTAGGATDIARVNLTVEDTTAPAINLSVPDTVDAGQQLTFDATDSTDNAGIARYEWDFGNGTTAAGPSLDSPTGAYADPGVYAVTLTSTDTSGNQATETATVVVGGANAVVSGPDIEFGAVGTSSMTSEPITVENTGTRPLEVTDANISGDDASAFGVSGDGVSVRPGETRALAVTFDPSAAGDHAATLEVETNSTGQKTFEGTLQGVGVESSLEPASPSVAFGDLRVGDRRERDVVIANRGTEGAVLTDVAIDSPHFRVLDAPERIGAGASERVTVAFAPDAAGSRTATLQVDARNDTAGVSLTGTGVGPAMALSADSLDVGTAGLGTSTTAELGIDNFGTRALAVENVAITGDDAAAFTIEDEPNIIAPGTSGSLEVRFSPEQPGAYDATLEIDGNDTAGPRTVDISGAGVGADIVVNRTTVDFGRTEIGQSYVEVVTVRNAGATGARLTVEDLQMTGSHAGAFTVGTPDTPFVLAPGEKRDIPVNFTTEVGDARQAQLQIHSDAANQPQVNVWLSNTRGYIAVREVSNPTVNVEGVNLPARSRYLVNVSTPSTQESPVTVDALEMTTGGDFEMNLSNAPKPFDNAFDAGNDTKLLQYVELDHIEGDPAETFENTGVHYRVDATAVPEGVTPEEVAIRRYDENTGEWRELDAALVRRTSDEYVYEVATPGFSEFVVTAPRRGPDITVSDASLAAATVPLGGSAQATVTLRNRGGETGEHTVELRVDGETVATRTVTVPAGAKANSTLTFAPDEAGTYSVAVGPAALGSLTVTVEDEESTPASAEESVDEGGSAATVADDGSSDDTDATGGPWLPAVGVIVGVLLLFVFVFRRRDTGGDERSESR